MSHVSFADTQIAVHGHTRRTPNQENRTTVQCTWRGAGLEVEPGSEFGSCHWHCVDRVRLCRPNTPTRDRIAIGELGAAEAESPYRNSYIRYCILVLVTRLFPYPLHTVIHTSHFSSTRSSTIRLPVPTESETRAEAWPRPGRPRRRRDSRPRGSLTCTVF